MIPFFFIFIFIFLWTVGISIYDLNDPASQFGNLTLSFSKNAVLLSNLLFDQLNVEDSAIITISNLKFQISNWSASLFKVTFINAKRKWRLWDDSRESNQNKRAILHQLYFGFIPVHSCSFLFIITFMKMEQ